MEDEVRARRRRKIEEKKLKLIELRQRKKLAALV